MLLPLRTRAGGVLAIYPTKLEYDTPIGKELCHDHGAYPNLKNGFLTNFFKYPKITPLSTSQCHCNFRFQQGGLLGI